MAAAKAAVAAFGVFPLDPFAPLPVRAGVVAVAATPLWLPLLLPLSVLKAGVNEGASAKEE